MADNGVDFYVRLYKELSQCPDCSGEGKVAVTVWPGDPGLSREVAPAPLKLTLTNCNTCGGSGRVPIGSKYTLQK